MRTNPEKTRALAQSFENLAQMWQGMASRAKSIDNIVYYTSLANKAKDNALYWKG